VSDVAPFLSRQYCKVCEVEDFADPVLRAKLREIAAPQPAAEHELHRKFWEYALLGLYLEEVGALDEDARVLSVAAGHEEPLYWLADRAGHVLATDIYGAGRFATSGREADASMLEDPGRWAPRPYRADRLEVRSMDALDLQIADASFDVVFSLSSIEHFGGAVQVRRAVQEMVRVLRPGGHLLIATELLLRPHPLDWRPVQVAVRMLTGGRRAPGATLRTRVNDGFRPRELRRDVIDATGLQLVQPLDLSISPATMATSLPFEHSGGRFPHVVLKAAAGSPWTSVFLAFRR
jgi:SAM-dependent methyltransferase